MSGISDAIGLGVTIALFDAFTSTGNSIIGKMKEVASEAEGGAERVKAALGQMESGLMLAAGGGAVLFALDRATQRAGEFSHAVAEVSTLVDEANFSTQQIRDTTMSLAATYGGSAKDQAKGLYQTISAGIMDAAKAAELLSVANELAVGGVTDVKTAVDGLTNVVNAYAGDAITARDASDAFFVATMAGKTTPEELAKSIGQVAPIAAQMKVSLYDLLTATAAITTQGLDTSMAVTGIRQALINITHPTKDAREEAKRLGIEFTAAHLRAVGFKGFLDEITHSAGFNSDSMSKLFHSVEGLNSMMALTANGGATFNEFLGLMENRQGATQKAFEKMAATLPFQQSRFKALTDNGIIRIGSALESTGAKALSFANTFLVGFSQIPAPILNTTVKAVALAASLAVLVGGVMAVQGAMKAWVFFGPLAEAALGGILSTAASMLPVLIGLAAIGSMVYIAWSRDLGGLRTLLTGWWDHAKLVVQGLWELFTSDSNGVGGIGAELQRKLMDAGLWPLVQNLYVWGGLVLDFFDGVWGGIKAVFAILATAATPFLWSIRVVLAVLGALWDVVTLLLIPTRTLAAGTETAGIAATFLGLAVGFVIGALAVYAGWLAIVRTYQMGLAFWQGIMQAKLVVEIGLLYAKQIALNVVTAATVLWEAAQWGLNAALAANPIGVVILGLLALAGLVAVVIAYWDEWKGVIIAIGTGLGLLLFGPLALFIGAIVAIVTYFDELELAALKAWRAIKLAFGGEADADLDKQIKDLESVIAAKDAAASSGDTSAGVVGPLGNGVNVLPSGAQPSIEDMEGARAAAADLGLDFNQLAAGAGLPGAGSAPQVVRQTEVVNFNVDGKTFHSLVRGVDGELRERAYGGGD